MDVKLRVLLYDMSANFSRNLGAISKFQAPECCMKQVQYREPQNTKSHHRKFILHCNKAPGICAPPA